MRRLLLILAFLGSNSLALERAPSSVPSKVQSQAFVLSTRFEPNVGQFDAGTLFYARTPRYDVVLTSDGAVFAPRSAKRRECGSVKRLCSAEVRRPFRIRLNGDKRTASPVGRRQLQSHSNYLIGSDPRNWHSDVPNFGEVWYDRVYPGIDLVFYERQGRLEYDFVVAPHANPTAISFSIEDVTRGEVKQDAAGNLILLSGESEIRFNKPHLLQGRSCLRRIEPATELGDGSCKVVAGGRFRLTPKGSKTQVAFELPKYDRDQPLIIDPVVAFSTFLGGDADDYANGVATDSMGNIYLVGTTDSSNFPVTANAFQKSLGTGGGNTAFVTKLSGDGSSLIYSTFLGGGMEFAHGIAVDASGNAYVTGETYGTNFPLVNPYQSTNPSGSGFISKLSPDGSTLIFSTFLGGSVEGTTNSIAVDSSGEVVVAGRTYAVDFPVLNAFQPSHASDSGREDAFVTKFSASGSSLIFSTYLGGNSDDLAQGVALDALGNIYVGGLTYSSNFPTSSGAYETTLNATIGGSFVSKFSPTGTLAYSTYLVGGQVFGIAANTQGNAFVTGMASTQLPVTPGAFQAAPGGSFVTEFDTTGSSLVYSTFLGGDNTDTGNAIAVDSSGNAYVTGQTFSLNFPLKDPVQSTMVAGVPAAFVSEFNNTGSQLSFSTYLDGGAQGYGNSQGNAIAVDGSGNLFVAGGTSAPDFPILNAIQPAIGGYQNVFLIKFLNEPSAAISASPSSLSFPTEVVGVASPPQPIMVTNVGNAPLNIQSVAMTGDFSQTNNCPSKIPPQAGCTIKIVFTPSTFGSESGTMTVASNATIIPELFQFSGEGQDFVLVSSSGPVTVSSGQAATYKLSLLPESGFAKKISFSCSGVPQGATCSVTPASIKLNGVDSGTATVTVATTASSAALTGLPTTGDPGDRYIGLRWVMIFGPIWALIIALTGRGRKASLVPALLVLGGSLLACGGSGNGNTGGGTPSGIYTVSVTGTSTGGLNHSLLFTLVVN